MEEELEEGNEEGGGNDRFTDARSEKGSTSSGNVARKATF